MTVLTLLAVLLVGQPDRPPDGLSIIPDLPAAPAGSTSDPGVPPSPRSEDGPAETRSPDALHPSAGPLDLPAPWPALADCESGDWLDGGAAFVEGSARWDWGAPGMELPPWGTRLHHGGLQFAPSTWEWVAPDVLDDPPAHAYEATPAEQVAVAVEVQARQGWQAWPVCSRKVGLR